MYFLIIMCTLDICNHVYRKLLKKISRYTIRLFFFKYTRVSHPIVMNSDKKINMARALTAYVNLTLTCCDVLGCLSTHKTYKKIGICIYLVIYARTNTKKIKRVWNSTMKDVVYKYIYEKQFWSMFSIPKQN